MLDDVHSEPWRFGNDCADLRRELEAIVLDDRLKRFRERCREHVRWIGRVDKQTVVDRLTEVAQATGIDVDDAQAAIAEAIANPYEPPKLNGSDANTALASDFDWRSLVKTAADLRHQSFPEVAFVVDGILPEGLTILAGKPKIGKSWLALDLCLAVAGGWYCLGDKRPATGDVLYAALEDNPRRLQRRITKLLGVAKEPWPERLSLATQWRRLDKGGVDDLAGWIESADGPRLIILDTLAGVRPIKTTTGYTDDYESLAALHRLANDKGIAILVLHHTRKMEAEDPVDTVSGTLGLAGCADTVLVLARSSKGSTLYIRGRDIEEAEHAVEFQKEACKWTILGDATSVRRSAERQSIIAMLESGAEPMGPSEIADAAGMKPGNVKKLLHFMVKDGEVRKEGHGRYVAA